MEGRAQTLITGLSGAALLAVLFTGQGKVPFNAPANSTTAANATVASPVSADIQRTGLDQNGPWSAICEEFASGLDRRLAAPVVCTSANSGCGNPRF